MADHAIDFIGFFTPLEGFGTVFDRVDQVKGCKDTVLICFFVLVGYHSPRYGSCNRWLHGFPILEIGIGRV